MTRLLLLLASLGLAASTAAAAPKKYHFELAAVTAKSSVKPEVAKTATPRVEAQVKKAFATHPQIVAKLDGAPDWKSGANPDAYRKFLARKHLAGAYLVTVEITDASEELVPMDKPNSQRLVVKIAIHMLGETIPARTMGFSGDGQATIKLEVGKKLRERDREYTWDSAAELAIKDAMATVFKQLAAGGKHLKH